MKQLDRRYRSAGLELFKSDTFSQVTETYFWHGGGKPLVVTDIDSATRALEVIIDQDEGASGGIYDGECAKFGQQPELSHYCKLCKLLSATLPTR